MEHMSQASSVPHAAQREPSGSRPPSSSRAPAGGPMTASRRDRTDPIDQPAVPAILRLRSKWLVLGTILGAVLGLVFALVFEAGRYTAETVLQVAPTQNESQRAAQLAQAVTVLAGSSAVLNEAAEATDVGAADLRRRTSVIWEDSTSIVTVAVQSRSSRDAQEQSTAVAEAIISQAAESSKVQLEAIREQATGALSTETLPDPTAEDARKSTLGNEVAQRQGAAIGSGTQIEIINPADRAEPSGITSPIGTVLGAFAGLALATAAAAFLPVTRHRIRDNREIAMLAPSLRLYSRRAAHEQAGRLMESHASTLAVLAMPGAEESARQLADRIVRVIGAHGLSAQLVDARQGLTSEQASVLRRGDRNPADARLHILVVPADEDTVELLAGQTEVLSAVVSVPRRTRLEDIQDVASAVATTGPVAIIWS